MSTIKKITKEVFQTTDGAQFETSAEATKHQEFLDAPKVFIILSSYQRVYKCFLDEQLAIDYADKMNKKYSGTYYTINTFILETK